MGNQLIKKSQVDCKIVLLGNSNSGKTTLFKHFLSQFTEENENEIKISLRTAYTEEFLLNILKITIEVGKLCLTSTDKFINEKSIKLLEMFIKEEKNPTKEKLFEIKQNFPKIWKEIAMKAVSSRK